MDEGSIPSGSTTKQFFPIKSPIKWGFFIFGPVLGNAQKGLNRIKTTPETTPETTPDDPMTINFNLKKKDDHSGTVVAVWHKDKRKLKYFTGLDFPWKDWDPKKRRLKGTTAENLRINKKLGALELKINELIDQYNQKGIWPDTKSFKKAIESEGIVATDFFHAFTQFEIANGRKNSDALIKKCRQSRSILERLQDHIGHKLTFDTFTIPFYDEILHFLNLQGYAKNTQGTHIKFLKTFLKWAELHGHHQNQAYKNYKSYSEEVAHVILHEDELMTLFKFPFDAGSTADEVRLRWCFRAFSGIRVSDLNQLTWANIQDDSIHLTTQKTNDRLVIPLNKYSREIIDHLRKRDAWFKDMTPDDENLAIKIVAEAAGLKRVVKMTRTIGGKRVTEEKPVHALISTHTAKRTFVTLSLAKGMPETTVMAIVGNKDFNSLKPYIKIAGTMTRKAMTSVWG